MQPGKEIWSWGRVVRQQDTKGLGTALEGRPTEGWGPLGTSFAPLLPSPTIPSTWSRVSRGEFKLVDQIYKFFLKSEKKFKSE